MSSQMNETSVPHDHTILYTLALKQQDNQPFYIWRRYSYGPKHGQTVLLINLNNIFLPDDEIEKMIFQFNLPENNILAVLFANCNIHNRRSIKRKLKAHNVQLFSKTTFFPDLAQAKQWLALHTANH